MYSRLIALITLVLSSLVCTPAFAQWTECAGLPANIQLSDIWLTSRTNGLALGYYDDLFVTSDAGATWHPSSLYSCTQCLVSYRSIFFLNHTGYITIDIEGKQRNTMTLLSTDNGSTWNPKDTLFNFPRMITSNFGYMIRSQSGTGSQDGYATMYVTHDAGRTYDSIYDAPNLYPYLTVDASGVMGDSLNGFFDLYTKSDPEGGNQVYTSSKRTTDGGSTWLDADYAEHIPLGHGVWLRTDSNHVIRSTDYGATFHEIGHATFGLIALRPVTKDIIYSDVDQKLFPGSIAYTSDGGVHWNLEKVADSAIHVTQLRYYPQPLLISETVPEWLYIASPTYSDFYNGPSSHIYRKHLGASSVQIQSTIPKSLDVTVYRDRFEMTAAPTTASRRISVIDQLGRIMGEKILNAGDRTLSWSTVNLPNGLYHIKLEGEVAKTVIVVH